MYFIFHIFGLYWYIYEIYFSHNLSFFLLVWLMIFSPVGNFVVGSWCYIRNFINTYINFDFLNWAHINSINFSIGYLIFTKWTILKSEKWNWSCSVMSISWTWDPMDCSLPGSSIHGIFQSRILEWVDVSFYRRSLWLRDWTRVSHIVGRLYHLSHQGSIYHYTFTKFQSVVTLILPQKEK